MDDGFLTRGRASLAATYSVKYLSAISITQVSDVACF